MGLPAGASEAEDGDLGGIDNRRERRAADVAERADRHAATDHVLHRQTLFAGTARQGGDLVGDFAHALAVAIAHDRYQQTGGGVHRHSDVEVLL
ncbi:hypothetical protein D3C81_2005490 [compost metagenome]